MEKKVTMDFLAQELNLSKTTVSKAVNYCPGIAPCTRNAVVQAAASYGYTAIRSRIRQSVAVILPSSPDYFWGRIRRTIDNCSKETELSFRCYIYPRLSDPVGALQCLTQALSEEPSVLILAVPDSPEIRALLETRAERMLIVLIEEFLDIKNAFFVGGDPFRQGYRLAQRYIEAYPEDNAFAVLRTTDYATEKERIAGFQQALQDRGKILLAAPKADLQSKAVAASIARVLSGMKTLPECIMCPSGNIQHAADAVRKLKPSKRIHCIGFDMNIPGDRGRGAAVISHVLQQDIDSQALKAWECARNFLETAQFPVHKNIYVEDLP